MSVSAHEDLRIVALSIPKSGSFLLYRCIELITGKKAIHSYNGSDFTQWKTGFVMNHEVPYDETIALYKAHNIRGVFIARDPRDIVVSSAFFFKDNLKIPKAVSLSMPDLINDVMQTACVWWDYVVYLGKIPMMADINMFYRSLYAWTEQPFVYATTFEKLVGSRGGGDDAVQLQEIKNIAHHIGVILPDDRAHEIAKALFGRFTFREGKIGAWKEHFSDAHKTTFKQLTGSLLIELGYENNNNW